MKMAPVQGYSAGIPWEMHLRAYDVYCKRFGPQPALVDLEGRNCRGGFADTELDMFIPGWRKELSRIYRLESLLKQSRSALEIAFNTVECDSLDKDGNKLPWYSNAKRVVEEISQEGI
jgi:hypothetical protein